MPTKKHYESTFFSVNGQHYKVEIYHKTTEVTSTTEITLGKGGFDLTYKKLKDPFLGGIMSSVASVKFLVKDATDLTAAHTVLTAPNQSYYLHLKRTDNAAPNWDLINLFWAGWIINGFDNYPDMPFPYNVNIKANDSLGRQLNKYNNSATLTAAEQYENITYPFTVIEDNFDLDTAYTGASAGSSYFQWAWQTDWWNGATGTPGASDNPLRETYYNRAAFVDDPEDYPLTIQNPNDELAGVIKVFMLRVMQSAGRYWIQQANFLNSSTPDPSVSAHADAASGEIFPPTTAGEGNPITIDNSATPTTADKGIILTGARFSLRTENASVRAKYIFGSNFAPIPPNIDYTLGLTSIGFLSQGSSSLTLFLNHVMEQTLPLTGGSAVTPCYAQGDYMTGLLGCRLKVGNKYLRQVVGGVTPYELEWTTTESIFTVFTGAGTYYQNGPYGPTTSQENVMNALSSVGGGYPYPFGQWIDDFPTAGTATARLRFYLAGIPLPDLGATYGEVQFEIVNSVSYILYWTPDTPFTNIWNDWTTWLGEHNPDPSTNLDYDAGAVTPLTQTITNSLVPYGSNLDIEEEMDPDEDSAPIGAQYMISQPSYPQAPDLDLGNLSLGTNSSDNQITTIRFKDGSGDYVSPQDFRSGTAGAYVALGQLLVNEHFKNSANATVVLEGTIVSTAYEPHRAIIYEDEIDGTAYKWIFAGGKFNAESDSWTGSWYKLDLDTSSFTELQNDIYTGPDGPNPHDPDFPTGGGNRSMPLGANTESLAAQLGFLLTTLIVGTITEDVPKDSAKATVTVQDVKCKLFDGQKLYLVDRALRSTVVLTVDGAKTKGSTDIDFDSITPKSTYKTGSYILLDRVDLTNSISASPAGNDKEVQFNDGGVLGAEATFEYDKSTDILTARNFDGQHYGNNIGTIYDLQIYLSPLAFKTPSSYRSAPYTDDDGATLRPSSAIVNYYADFQVPLGCKATKVDLKASVDVSFRVLIGSYDDAVATSLGSGTTNTELTLTTALTGAFGDYGIIKFDPTATTDEIYGCKITLERT